NVRGSSPSTSVVPLSNQVTTLNHKRFKGFKMFSDGHLGFRRKKKLLEEKFIQKMLLDGAETMSWCGASSIVNNAGGPYDIFVAQFADRWCGFACHRHGSYPRPGGNLHNRSNQSCWR